MLKAAKRNRVLRIPDEKAAEYKKLGYTITTMDGKVIYKPENTAEKANALEAENADLQEKLHEAAEYAENGDKKIETLEAENAELKAKVSELEAALDEAETSAGADDEKIVALETENAELKAKIKELETAAKNAAKKTTKANTDK